MSKTISEKEKYFQHTEYTDKASAEQGLVKAEKILAINKIMLIVCAVSNVVGFILTFMIKDSSVAESIGGVFMAIAIIAAFVSGEVKQTLRYCWKLPYIAYKKCSIFLIDLLVFVIVFGYTLMSVVAFPIIPTLCNFRQVTINKKDAQEFLQMNQDSYQA